MFQSLETQGGHITVLVFVMMVGVWLSLIGSPLAHDIVVGAMAALLAVLKAESSK